MSKARVCDLLEISRSGYYKWLKKRENSDKDVEIREIIFNEFHYHKGRYGSRRLVHVLKYEGFTVNRKKVQRIMREMELSGYWKRRFKKTTNSKHKKEISPNLINGCFDVDAPHKLWVADITYIRTWEGWLYLNVVIDCFGRRIVAWRLRPTMCKEIVTESVLEGLRKEKPHDLIFHSDRGSQYASNELRKILKDNEVRQSMSGKGNCYDNAVAESFFKTLKHELRKRMFATRAEAELEIFQYIEMYYNTKRLHSTNNYRTPNQVYNEYKCS